MTNDLGTYAEDYLVGIFPDTAALESAATDLIERGFNEDGLDAYCGIEGAKELDPTGEEHGLLTRITRVVQNVFAEFDGLREYAAAAEAGACVLATPIPDEEQRETAIEVYRRHNADLISAFGKMTVERL
jgi:hypothetical protein